MWLTTDEAVRGGWFTSVRAAESYRAKRTGPKYVLKVRHKHKRRLYHVDDLDAWMRGTGLQCDRCKRIRELEAQIAELEDRLGAAR